MTEERELMVVHKQMKTQYMTMPMDIDITDSFADEVDEIVDLIRHNPNEAQNKLMAIANDLRRHLE